MGREDPFVPAAAASRIEVSPASGGYLPIAEHGLIGDLHTVALVGTEGTIDWYCCPRFDAPSLFPQAFTHLALISATFNLDRALGAGN